MILALKINKIIKIPNGVICYNRAIKKEFPKIPKTWSFLVNYYEGYPEDDSRFLYVSRV